MGGNARCIPKCDICREHILNTRIFVTVGSQKFQFDRLLRAVDNCKAKGVIEGDVFAQTGYSNYMPKSYKSVRFLDRDGFARTINRSEIVITHGGTGIIINALKNRKRVIAMARLAEYGEHVDNHQEQVLKSFNEAGLIKICDDEESLSNAYKIAIEWDPVRFESGNTEFVGNLDKYLESLLLK